MATQASDTSNKQRARGASPDELAVVAQRAQAFTNASGVAIALSEGNADEIVCRARSGSAAPEVGTTLRVEGSFTGLCISSGKELRCDDCETDTRVDTVAIRALGIRSMVVTPIKEENRVIGVLAVFAPTPHAFTITHVAVLKTMGDQIAALLQRERRTREEGQQPESARPPAPAPVTMPKPVMSAPAPVVPPPVVIKPSSSGSVPVVRAAAPVVSRVEQVKASAHAESAPAVVIPKKDDRRTEHKSEQTHRTSFGTLESVGGETNKPRSNMMAIGVVAVLVIAAGGTYAFLKLRKPEPSATQHAQTTSPAVPAGGAPSASTGTQPVTTAENPATTASNPGGPAPTTAKTSPVRDTAESARKTDKNNTVKPADRNTAPQEKPAPEKPAPTTVALATGPSKITTQGATPSAPDVAPSFTVGGGNTPSALSALARPTASSTPSAAAIEQSQLEPLQLIKQAPLSYPAIAKARRLSGTVVVQVKVGKDGKVTSPQFISGPMVFHDAAFEAVLQYQFKPAKLNGQPIEQSTQIKMTFKPN